MQIQNRYVLPSFVAASPADHALVSYIQILTGQFRPIAYNDFVHPVDANYNPHQPKAYSDEPTSYLLMFVCCETPSNENYTWMRMFSEIACQIHNKLIRGYIAALKEEYNMTVDNSEAIWHNPEEFETTCKEYLRCTENVHQIRASFAYRKYFQESIKTMELAMTLVHGEPEPTSVRTEYRHPLINTGELKTYFWSVK